MCDTLELVISRPPKPDNPVNELYRSNTVPMLQKRLSNESMSIRGSKSDLALRLANHEMFVTITDIDQHFTVTQLRERLLHMKKCSKRDLCIAYLKHLESTDDTSLYKC